MRVSFSFTCSCLSTLNALALLIRNCVSVIPRGLVRDEGTARLDHYHPSLKVSVQHQQNLPSSLNFFQPTNRQMALPMSLRYTHTHVYTPSPRVNTQFGSGVRSTVNLSSNKVGGRERDESEKKGHLLFGSHPQLRSPGHFHVGWKHDLMKHSF